eukprot:g26769.t1
MVVVESRKLSVNCVNGKLLPLRRHIKLTDYSRFCVRRAEVSEVRDSSTYHCDDARQRRKCGKKKDIKEPTTTPTSARTGANHYCNYAPNSTAIERSTSWRSWLRSTTWRLVLRTKNAAWARASRASVLTVVPRTLLVAQTEIVPIEFV